jgi:hypothetical protein
LWVAKKGAVSYALKKLLSAEEVEMFKRVLYRTGLAFALPLVVLVATIVMPGGPEMGPAFASPSVSSNWKATELPLPANATTGPGYEPIVGALSCPAPGFCVATASYFDAQSHIHGVIETLSGGIWTARAEPVPATASYSYLGALSCPTVTYCVAVGWYATTLDAPMGLIETLSGGQWTPRRAPIPTNAPSISSVFFNAIACPVVDSCVAVGSYHPVPNSSYSDGLIETLAARQWTAVEAPVPPNAYAEPGLQLGSVTCATVGSCVSIGDYTDTRGDIPRVIETLSGGTWVPTSVPTEWLGPAECPAPGSCIAVGQNIHSGQSSPLVETLSSGTWRNSTTPLPANTVTKGQWSFLSAIACPPLGSCVALGDYHSTNSIEDGLVETLVQGTWTPEELQPPAPSSSLNQNALACADASFCAAVGAYSGRSGSSGGLIETMTDGSWTASAAPVVKNGGSPYLNDVECPGRNSCIAVGTYLDGNGNYQLVAESLGEGRQTS